MEMAHVVHMTICKCVRTKTELEPWNMIMSFLWKKKSKVSLKPPPKSQTDALRETKSVTDHMEEPVKEFYEHTVVKSHTQQIWEVTCAVK